NGHPDDRIEEHSSHVQYKEPLLLYHNNGKTLENVSGNAGPAFQRTFAARGLAIGDMTNTGALDVLISMNGEPPLVLKNQAAAGGHWLGVKLVGKRCNADATGAKLAWTSGNLKRTQMKVGGGSYLSSHDPRMVLGLGANSRVDRLDVQWPPPSGEVETFKDLP